MKKRLFLYICFVLCAATAVLLFGCNREVISVYTMSDGKTVSTLTLNETEMTFLLVEESDGKTNEYDGKFSYKDGSVVLESTNFGYRTVKITGDNFEFIANPSGKEEIKEPCEHTWDAGVHTSGDCLTYGTTLYTCTKCKETKVERDKQTGSHTLDSGRHVSGQTCSDRGYTLYTCVICKNYTERVDDPENSENHVYVATDTVRDDGCTVVLKRLYRCSRCNAEKYLNEDSRAIGSHDYDAATGICKTCHRMKNGLSTVHEYLNDSDICYHCKVKKSVLEGVVANPCGYTEDNKTYIGVYPQILAPQSAKEISANGLYDAALDCWYYGSETYVIRKAEVRSDVDRTFSSGDKITVGESYAFILQPLAFDVEGEKYVSDCIIDAAAFLKQYAVINNNGAVTNDWDSSTLKGDLGGIKDRIGVEEIEIDLATTENLPLVKIKTVTDYALAGGLSFFESEGKRLGRWYTRTPAEGSGEVKCVGYEGATEDTNVTAVRGIVPVVWLREGE